jgi:hypothetical protein
MSAFAITNGISLSEKIAYLKTDPAVLNRVIYSGLKGAAKGIILGIIGVIADRTMSRSFSFAPLLSPNPLSGRLVVLMTLLKPTPLSISFVAISCIIQLVTALTKEDFRVGNSSQCLGWKLGTMEPIPEEPTAEQKLQLAQEYLWNKFFIKKKSLLLKSQEKQARPETARLIARIDEIKRKCKPEIKANARISDIDNYQFRQHNIFYRSYKNFANISNGLLLNAFIYVPLSIYFHSRLDFLTINLKG